MRFLLLFLLLHLHHRHSAAARRSRLPEYRVLLSIKASITEDPQSALASWNATTSHCTWKGATCDSCTRHIESQSVKWLNGSIPIGLLSLPQLTQIELQNNLLSGSFPETNVPSTTLGQINLSNNHLTGRCHRVLVILWVYRSFCSMVRNTFSGSIPSDVGKLQQLSKLDFNHNEFTGPILPEISSCKLLIFIHLCQPFVYVCEREE